MATVVGGSGGHRNSTQKQPKGGSLNNQGRDAMHVAGRDSKVRLRSYRQEDLRQQQWRSPEIWMRWLEVTLAEKGSGWAVGRRKSEQERSEPGRKTGGLRSNKSCCGSPERWLGRWRWKHRLEISFGCVLRRLGLRCRFERGIAGQGRPHGLNPIILPSLIKCSPSPFTLKFLTLYPPFNLEANYEQLTEFVETRYPGSRNGVITLLLGVLQHEIVSMAFKVDEYVEVFGVDEVYKHAFYVGRISRINGTELEVVYENGRGLSGEAMVDTVGVDQVRRLLEAVVTDFDDGDFVEAWLSGGESVQPGEQVEILGVDGIFNFAVFGGRVVSVRENMVQVEYDTQLNPVGGRLVERVHVSQVCSVPDVVKCAFKENEFVEAWIEGEWWGGIVVGVTNDSVIVYFGYKHVGSQCLLTRKTLLRIHQKWKRSGMYSMWFGAEIKVKFLMKLKGRKHWYKTRTFGTKVGTAGFWKEEAVLNCGHGSCPLDTSRVHCKENSVIKNLGPILSHLAYADDVMFMGEWSDINLVNLNRILRCFQVVSGLKVNLNKSKVFGVWVEEEEVSNMANILGCEADKFPFTYLGLPIGANMRLSKHWEVIIEKFKSRLSSWKADSLSFGGRLTLIKSVLGSLPLYYFSVFKAPTKVIDALEGIRRRFLWAGNKEGRKIHWVSWNKIVLPKDKDGLGVGDLRSMNVALLGKWIWRMKTERDSLWTKCITACHNISHIDGKAMARASQKGVWWTIAHISEDLKQWNFSLEDSISRNIGDGGQTFFWKDRWTGNMPLKDVFPDLFKLESQKNCSIDQRLLRGDGQDYNQCAWEWKRNPRSRKEKDELHSLNLQVQTVKLMPKKDSWSWKEDKGGSFSVNSLRRKMVESSERGGDDNFKWVNWIPIKVNCFVWRLKQNRIPVISNLLSRGIVVGNSTCQFCQHGEESTEHVFFQCRFATEVWTWFHGWSRLISDIPKDYSSLAIELQAGNMEKKTRKLRTAMVYTVLWMIWKARNELTFKKKRVYPMHTADEIQLASYNWIKNRSRFKWLNWFQWCTCPSVNCTIEVAGMSFKEGDEVEVMGSDDIYRFSFHSATIQTLDANGAGIAYHTRRTADGEPMLQIVGLNQIRLIPDSYVGDFRFLWLADGWWRGMVLGGNQTMAIVFFAYREVGDQYYLPTYIKKISCHVFQYGIIAPGLPTHKVFHLTKPTSKTTCTNRNGPKAIQNQVLVSRVNLTRVPNPFATREPGQPSARRRGMTTTSYTDPDASLSLLRRIGDTSITRVVKDL
ncbi:hypothetical protein LXL04_017140 [Taraxacum kok-saghyz]